MLRPPCLPEGSTASMSEWTLPLSLLLCSSPVPRPVSYSPAPSTYSRSCVQVRLTARISPPYIRLNAQKHKVRHCIGRKESGLRPRVNSCERPAVQPRPEATIAFANWRWLFAVGKKDGVVSFSARNNRPGRNSVFCAKRTYRALKMLSKKEKQAFWKRRYKVRYKFLREHGVEKERLL